MSNSMESPLSERSNLIRAYRLLRRVFIPVTLSDFSTKPDDSRSTNLISGATIVSSIFMYLVLGFTGAKWWGGISLPRIANATSEYFVESVNTFTLIATLINGFLLFIFFSFVQHMMRVREQKSVARPSESQLLPLLPDTPLRAEDPDVFGWETFTERIANVVVLPPHASSIVVSIEAPWGQGKSSALTLVRRALDAHDHTPLVVSFNPWVASGEERIFSAFFTQLASQLMSKNANTLGEFLINFGSLVEYAMPQH